MKSFFLCAGVTLCPFLLLYAATTYLCMQLGTLPRRKTGKCGNFYHIGGSDDDGGDLVEPLVEVLRYHLKADVFNGCAWRKPKG